MIVTELQSYGNWEQPGNVGDTGGDSTKPHGAYLLTSGQEMLVSIKPGYAYDNFYFLKRLGNAFSWATSFTYHLEVFLSAIDLAKCQAFEFELQQNVAGQLYNMAWQADFQESKQWRVFNYIAKQWEGTGLTLPAFADNWISLNATFIRSRPAYLTHLGINDSIYFVTQPSAVENVADYFNVAFQLDSDSKGDVYQAKLRNVSVTFL